MKSIDLPERPDWRTKAEEAGFHFHTIGGEPYWDESSAYEFTLQQIEEDLEAPTTELHAMCREAVAHVTASEELMEKMDIPRQHWDLVANSWRAGEPELYGRFDLRYDGTSPAVMLEYNADTPTSYYEAATFQWEWLEDMVAAGALPQGSDQFNSIFDKTVDRFAEIFAKDTDVHFASVADHPEDLGTVETLAWAARHAGLGAHYTTMQSIGITDTLQFADGEGRVMGALFKLYPWEDLLREEFSQYLAGAQCRYLEPAWKAVLSNKAILPILWEMFEGHPNLLPAFFDSEMSGPRFDRAADAFAREGMVRKPIFSREGADITIESADHHEVSPIKGYGAHRKIVQLYRPLPRFARGYAVIGSWVVGQEACGIGIREDNSLITQDSSRFKPHYIKA